MSDGSLIDKLDEYFLSDACEALSVQTVTDIFNIIRQHFASPDVVELASRIDAAMGEYGNMSREEFSQFIAEIAIAAIMGADEPNGKALQVGSEPRSVDEPRAAPANSSEISDAVDHAAFQKACDYWGSRVYPDSPLLKEAIRIYLEHTTREPVSVSLEKINKAMDDFNEKDPTNVFFRTSKWERLLIARITLDAAGVKYVY